MMKELGEQQVPFKVEQRMIITSLRELLSRGSETDWNHIALCLETLEGAVTRQMELKYITCLRQTKLFAAQRRVLNDEDVAGYSRMVDTVCRAHGQGGFEDDKRRFLAVVADPIEFKELKPDTALLDNINCVLDDIEKALPPSFLTKASPLSPYAIVSISLFWYHLQLYKDSLRKDVQKER